MKTKLTTDWVNDFVAYMPARQATNLPELEEAAEWFIEAFNCPLDARALVFYFQGITDNWF